MPIDIKETWRISDIVISALIFLVSLFIALIIFDNTSFAQEPDDIGITMLFFIFPIAFLYKKYPFDMFFFKLDARSTLVPVLIGFAVMYITRLPFPPSEFNLENIRFFANEYTVISELGWGWKSFYVLNLIVLTPILSELYFRGYIYRILKNRYDAITGAVVSSIIYSAFHFELATAFLETFIPGLFLAYIYEKSNSIIAAILVQSMGSVIWLAACYWAYSVS